jgi:endonuclease/exonuclease/phosphatase family metal-dependent hydrolase
VAAEPGAGGTTAGPPATIRVVTLNLWGEQGPLARRLALCEQQLRALRPDVLALQEVREIPGQLENTAASLARALQLHWVFAETLQWGGGAEGLAILSRVPILAHDHTALPHATASERRIVLSAALDFAGTPVAAFTTHLNYRMGHGCEREDQVEAVDRYIAATTAKLTPAAALTLLMGDFNATPDSDELRFLRGLHSLRGRRTYYQDAFLVHSDRERDAGLTWSRRNPYTQRLRFLQTDRRLDYIFVGGPDRKGRGVVHTCRVVLDEGDADGVFPSDHFGVLAEVQLLPLPEPGTQP